MHILNHHHTVLLHPQQPCSRARLKDFSSVAWGSEDASMKNRVG